MAGNAHGTDHRRNTEDLLTALAALLHQGDRLTEEVRLARRRRSVARHSIAVRMLAERHGRPAAA